MSALVIAARASAPRRCASPACPRRLLARGIDLVDRGNLDGPRNPWQPPDDGYRHLKEVVDWNRVVMEAVAAELAAGRMPILLGGDHCLGIGSITAVANHCRRHRQEAARALARRARRLQHAQRHAVGEHPRHAGRVPVRARPARTDAHRRQRAGDCRPGEIRQIGIRSVDEGEKRLVKEHGLDVYDMRYIDEVGMKRAMEAALEGVDADTHVHVSFDVDFLDPSIAPGVGTTVPGGPNYREAQLVMEMIADSGRMGSLDIVELNPLLDARNATAQLAVDLVESLFGKSTLMRD